jgi:hypothetical protein
MLRLKSPVCTMNVLVERRLADSKPAHVPGGMTAIEASAGLSTGILNIN